MGKDSEDYDYPEPEDTDSSEVIATMMAAMGQMQTSQGMMMQQMQESQAMQGLLQPPTIESDIPIDWESRRKSLKDEISRDATKAAGQKRGRASTVLTSGLEEDPDVISSILSGEENA